MEANIRKELDTLMKMVHNWKQDYQRWVTPAGGDDFLAREFLEEIERHVVPYVHRMYACEYLTSSEAEEFLDSCYGQVNELRDLIMAAETQN